MNFTICHRLKLKIQVGKEEIVLLYARYNDFHHSKDHQFITVVNVIKPNDN